MAPVSAKDKRREDGIPGLKLPHKVTPGIYIPPALGNRIAEVAQAYGKSEAELRALCSKDRNSIKADENARLFYSCAALPVSLPPIPLPPAGTQGATGTGVVTKPSYPLSETFYLSSNLNASKTIYLDFTGHTTKNTVWNNSITGGQDIVTPPYDIDGDPSSFSDAELANIQDIWKRVAEDFAPFNVNVTTKEPPLGDLKKDDDDDIFYGIRVVIGGSSSDWFGTAAGGVAYIGSFDWSSDSPAFVFPAQLSNGAPKYVGEAVSHEAGHTFGLSHDGNSYSEYDQGHANWAPIMGVAYYQPVSHWSKGEYSGANNTEDDTAIIAQEVGYRTDAQGNTMQTASLLSGPTLYAEGIIETRTDVDYYKFYAGAGTATINVTPDNVSPNLDVQIRLFSGTGTLLATVNPTTMNATYTKTLAQGTYYLEVDGIGTGLPTRYYNDYGSLGQYRVTVTAAPAVGQPPVAVASQSAPLTGIAPVTVTFSSAGSYDPDGTIKSYAWKFGDGGTAITATAVHAYTIPGTYTATLTVTDNSGLSSMDSVVIVVSPPPPVFVSNIGMAIFAAPYAKYYAQATVTITDQNGAPVPNATVAGTWSGLVRGSYTAKTDANGVAIFNSPQSSSYGTYTFTVTGVTATGYKYDPTKSKETKDSITRQ